MNLQLRMCLLFVAVLSGCVPQKNDLWIEPNSTAAHLVFGLGKTRGGDAVDQFGVLRVFRCDANGVGSGAAWVLTQESDGPAVERVVYGETPPGYRSEQGPEALVPGCYQAIATTGGLVEFNVLPDGTIEEVEPRVRWDGDK